LKSLLTLVLCVLSDAEAWCCTSATHDRKTIMSRFKNEGTSFLTITLPAYAKGFERSLDVGQVDPSLFPSFGKHKGLPRFLGGFLDLVFDRNTGRLLADPSHEAIFYIRQITLMCKKILLPCTKERERNAFDEYVKCEYEVRSWGENVPERLIRRFGRISHLLWDRDLSVIDRKVYEGHHVPRHGPGTTAERIVANAKFVQPTWTERLERNFFQSSEFLIPNSGYYEELSSIDFVEPGRELPVRVVSVPKTLKTPRIIAIEPLCMQYAQQSLMELFVDQLERSDYLSGSIGFTDQVPNQLMAMLGSSDGSLSTIDLSEASDRVSNRLVQELFSPYRSLLRALMACRTWRADVPGHGVIPLAKFAAMGSAVCFPVEAMVFLTICVLAIEDQLNRPLKRSDLRLILQQVRVYGDDIIVPTEYVRSVTSWLSAFGMKVNTAKSFWTGKFRESCGRDYYDGSDVTVTYVRRLLPRKRKDVSEVMSLVSLRNQLYSAGLWISARHLDGEIRKIIPFPNVEDSSPILGRKTYLGYSVERQCPNLHHPLVRGVVARVKHRPSPLDGVYALMKFFLKRGVQPLHDVKHLERSGRPLSVDIKTRWAPPF
jgi:hypothetical protein